MPNPVDAQDPQRGTLRERFRAFSAHEEVHVIVGLVITLLLPIAITLSVVNSPPGQAPDGVNPTPHGYTVSLLIFLFPLLAAAWWHWSERGHSLPVSAFWTSAALMALVGVLLDIAFGYHFFRFPNEAATLGIRIPAWSWCLPGGGPCRMGWVPDYLPVEEFAFYILGGLFMVATYVWSDRNWLESYDPNRPQRSSEARRLVGWNGPLLLIWIVVWGAAFTFKQFVGGGGFPGYFTFLICLGFVPIALLWRVNEYVNWRAFLFALSALVTVSIIWEATLGVPFEWWVYKDEQMLGLFIEAWWHLPVEAVLLWLVGSWNAIMLFEALRLIFARREAGHSLRHSVLGKRQVAGSAEAPESPL